MATYPYMIGQFTLLSYKASLCWGKQISTWFCFKRNLLYEWCIFIWSECTNEYDFMLRPMTGNCWLMISYWKLTTGDRWSTNPATDDQRQTSTNTPTSLRDKESVKEGGGGQGDVRRRRRRMHRSKTSVKATNIRNDIKLISEMISN